MPIAVPALRAGTLVVQGELNVAEIAAVTSRMRSVLALVQGGGAGLDAALAARLAALRLGAPPSNGPAPLAAATAASLPGPAARAPPLQPQFPPAAAAPRAAPPRAPAAAPPPRQQQQPAPAPARAVPPPTPAPVPAPAPSAVPGWSQCFGSDPVEHGSSAVAALAYVPRIPGLPGGDGHMGWLISSSRRLLNLFECNAGGSRDRDVPSLMVRGGGGGVEGAGVDGGGANGGPGAWLGRLRHAGCGARWVMHCMFARLGARLGGVSKARELERVALDAA